MFKASVISAIGALAKLIAGFVLIKLIALILGPDGLGLMGQFMSLSNIMILLAGGGISTGIIKYVAEYLKEQKTLSVFIGSVSLYAIISSIILLFIGLCFAPQIGFFLFSTNEFDWLVRLLFILQFGIALNNILLSWVSGHKDIIGTNIINVSGTFFSLLLLVPLSYFFDTKGLLAGLAIVPAAPVIVSLIYVYKKYPHVFLWLKPTFNNNHFFKLSRFSLMLITTVICMPLVQMLLRNDLVEVSNWDVAGYWQAAIRLSDAYLLFINMVLANYYMPRLSEIGKGREQIITVWRSMLIMLPIVIVLTSSIWLLRDFLVPLLFSNKFIPAYEFIYYQLIGDIFKMTTYVIGYLVIANAMTKLSIAGDLCQAVLFYFIAQYFISKNGAIGVAEGYAITYAFYFSLILLIFSCYSLNELRKSR